MDFPSATFLFFFLPTVIVGYYSLVFIGTSLRILNLFLCVASLLFYTWGEPSFAPILILTLMMNYLLGRWLDRHPSSSILAFGILANVTLLLLGKTTMLFPRLPLGVSFFTFQAISYLTDVYRRSVNSESNLMRYGLFTLFFPHLVAGPIVRYADLNDSLRLRTSTWDSVAAGIRRFVFGLSKKLLLADSFAEVANATFDLAPGHLSTSAAWLGIVCFSLQIYYDFSGYSDMAIGLAAIFGIHFPENFRHPYSATSMTDFWRRWHISLSNWFRDYVYIPLGGSRHSRYRTVLNLLIVFVLCGLWHGLNTTFLVWGLFHGCFLVLERLIPRMQRLGFIGMIYVSIMVCISWVFFRSPNLDYAWQYLQSLFGLTSGNWIVADFWLPKLAVIGPIGLLACTPLFSKVADLITLKYSSLKSLFQLSQFVIVNLLMFMCLIQVIGKSYQPFLYARF